MELNHWDIILWISGYVGNICLMAVLCAKKRYKAFPWFTLFLANELVQDPLLALLAHYGSAKHYFYTYWSLDVLDSLLLLLVIFELSRTVTRVIDEYKNIFRPRDLFWLAAALLITVISCLALAPRLPNPIVTLALKAATMASITMCGLTVYVFLAAFFYGVRFRVHAVSITYGLTAFSLTRMLVYVAVLSTGSADVWELLSRWSKPVYILMLFGWSLMLWLEEPKRKISPEMCELIVRTRYIERAQSR
jgi:hypothetical protein